MKITAILITTILASCGAQEVSTAKRMNHQWWADNELASSADGFITDGKLADDGDMTGSVVGKIMDTRGANHLTLFFDFEEVGAGTPTAVTWYCEGGHDYAGTSGWYRVQGGTYSSGTETVEDHLASRATTASDNWPYTYTINYPYVRCTFACTGTCTADTMDVYGWLGVL